MYKFFKTLLILSVLLCSSVVYAQSEFQLETQTVTAEKRQEDSQKVAIPITVLNDVDLADKNISSLDDVTAHVPNLGFVSGGSSENGYFTFRGLMLNVFTERQPISLNLDGVAWDSRYGLGLDFSNIERIEFLRGPQGTLYGKNAMGGVINVVTKEPGNETEGIVRTKFEENSTYGADFRISSPVKKDVLFFSLSGSYFKTDGFMEDKTPGGEEHWDRNEELGLSAKMVYKNSDKFKGTLHYKYTQVDGAGTPQIVGRDIKYSDTKGFKDPSVEREGHDTAFKAELDLNFADLISITSYRSSKGDSDQYSSYEPEYGGYNNMNEEHLSQEFRLKSKDNQGTIEWLAGLYADKASYDKWVGMHTDYSVYGPGLGVYTDEYQVFSDIYTYAAFGEITSPLFTEKLKLTLGARYETIKQEMDRDRYFYDYDTGTALPYDISGTSMPAGYDMDETWGSLLGKASLSYERSENVMYYFTVAQGYMPGGFNFEPDNSELAKFNEQKSLDYELGVKSTLFNRKLMLNVNIFRTEYTDLQVMQVVSGYDYNVSNAGKAHVQGVEADFMARPAVGLDIFGNLGIMEAEYDKYEEMNQVTMVMDNYKGNKMVSTPAFSGMIGAKYRHSAGFFGMADYTYFGTTYFNKSNESAYKRDPFGLINMKIGYEHESGFEVYAYVRNLTDKEYFTDAFEGYEVYTVGEPRTFGMQAVYRF